MSFSCCATAKPNVMNIAINKIPTEEDIINQVTQVKSKIRYDTKDTGTDRNGRRNETNKYLEYLLPFFHNLYDKIAKAESGVESAFNDIFKSCDSLIKLIFTYG